MTIKNVKLVFDRRHVATSERTAPVEFAVAMGTSRRRYIPTGVRLYAGEWDAGEVVGRPDAAKLNKRLEAARLRANSQIVATITLYGELTDEAVDRIFGVERPKRAARPVAFVPWAREQNDISGVRPTTKRRRQVAIDKIEELGFIRTFADLTPAKLKRFDDCLRRDGRRCDYTIKSNYHKVLRWLCGQAVSAELIDRNPYDVFRPKSGRPKPRQPLTEAELFALRRAVLPERLARVRDLFIFCAYTGVAYADSQLITARDVVRRSGVAYIDTTRRKTGTRFLTPMLAPAAEIFARYGGRLPVISNVKANAYLHEIEHRLNLSKPLTTHVARHTFATTVALAHGVPIESLSRMLGHRDIHTTQIYAKVLAQTVADDGAVLAAKIF